MANAPGATELVAHTTSGRRYEARRVTRLGDVDPAGALRLDATARYLQDVATDDAADCALDPRFGWLVRRTLIDVVAPVTAGETVELTTSCTGLGRSWAERRTSIAGDRGGRVEAASVWVQVDVATGRPARLTEQFMEIYGEACAGRTVSARLSLPAPDGDAATRPWAIRRTDLDQFDHVNNAANWAFLEEAVGTFTERRGRAEMDFLTPVGTGDDVDLRVANGPTGCAAWLMADAAVVSAARWRPHR